MAVQGHMFLFFPSMPIVYIDGLDHSLHCAKMTNTVFPTTLVSYSWPSITHLSLYFLRYSSPLLQSLKSCTRNLAFGMEQLYQRSPWTPSLYRHSRSCAEPSQWETCLTYIRTAIFHHLKITGMSREILSQAFLQKESFQKHLDHVILEKPINPVPRLLSQRNPLLFIPKKPSVYGGAHGDRICSVGQKRRSSSGLQNDLFSCCYDKDEIHRPLLHCNLCLSH